MFMPVDPIKGSLDAWSDILGGIWSMVQKFFKGAKELFTSGLDLVCEEFFKLFNAKELIEKIELYFKSPAQDLTYKQVFDILMKKNENLVKESKEDEMEEHMEKDLGQKVLTVIQGIFGVNAIGGLVVVLVNWISESFFKFDLMGWAQSLGISETLTNPGLRGFMPLWAIIGLIAIGVIALIKKADAWLATDKGTAGKIYSWPNKPEDRINRYRGFN